MSMELVYTSAPRGLKPGTGGFATVAHTVGMSRLAMMSLEVLSGYEFFFGLSDPSAGMNPPNFAHTLVKTDAGRPQSALSRVGFAGADYTGRANKIAHHFLLADSERFSDGPAVMMQWMAAAGVFCHAWNDPPNTLQARVLTPKSSQPSEPSPAVLWQQTTGDAGWAGVLAKAFCQDPKLPAYIVYSPGTDILQLFVESLAILPPALRWAVTFASYYTSMPAGCFYNWRAVLAASKGAEEVARFQNATIIDLTRRLNRVPDNEFTAAAREGRFVASPATLPRIEAAPPAGIETEVDRLARNSSAEVRNDTLPAAFRRRKPVLLDVDNGTSAPSMAASLAAAATLRAHARLRTLTTLCVGAIAVLLFTNIITLAVLLRRPQTQTQPPAIAVSQPTTQEPAASVLPKVVAAIVRTEDHTGRDKVPGGQEGSDKKAGNQATTSGTKGAQDQPVHASDEKGGQPQKTTEPTSQASPGESASPDVKVQFLHRSDSMELYDLSHPVLRSVSVGNDSLKHEFPAEGASLVLFLSAKDLGPDSSVRYIDDRTNKKLKCQYSPQREDAPGNEILASFGPCDGKRLLLDGTACPVKYRTILRFLVWEVGSKPERDEKAGPVYAYRQFPTQAETLQVGISSDQGRHKVQSRATCRLQSISLYPWPKALVAKFTRKANGKAGEYIIAWDKWSGTEELVNGENGCRIQFTAKSKAQNKDADEVVFCAPKQQLETVLKRSQELVQYEKRHAKREIDIKDRKTKVKEETGILGELRKESKKNKKDIEIHEKALQIAKEQVIALEKEGASDPSPVRNARPLRKGDLVGDLQDLQKRIQEIGTITVLDAWNLPLVTFTTGLTLPYPDAKKPVIDEKLIDTLGSEPAK